MVFGDATGIKVTGGASYAPCHCEARFSLAPRARAGVCRSNLPSFVSSRMIAQIDPANRPTQSEVETLFASSVTSFTEMKYQTISQSNDKASVRVTGFVNYELYGEKGRVPIDAQIPFV